MADRTIRGIVEKAHAGCTHSGQRCEDYARAATEEIVGLANDAIDHVLLLRKTGSKLMGPSTAKACVYRISGLKSVPSPSTSRRLIATQEYRAPIDSDDAEGF